MTPVIVGRGLRKRYAGFAPVLRGVNIEVMPGELVAIMGPSGCGKSTMLHVLGLLHAPDEGTLSILGEDVLGLNREQTAAFRRGNLGFVMQQSNLFDHSTVFENVEFPLIYEGVPSSERWSRVIRALELVRLTSRVHYPSNRLSGGEQQRVAIARAMVNAPRILMADEPTGALDARTSRLVMENFRTLCHSGGVALVMVTHDPKMADYCDSIYSLEEGLLVEKKHELPCIDAVDACILQGPKKRLNAAVVAGDFLNGEGEPFRAAAHLLHNEGLLADAVTLQGESLLGKEMQNYSLPMPVRHMGGLGAFGVICGYLGFGGLSLPSKDQAALETVSRLASAHGSKRWMLSQGKSLAQWCMERKTECLYAVDGVKAAFVSWVASRIADIPFGFDARSLDGWTRPEARDAFLALLKDAAFVRADTPMQRDALRSGLGAEDASKISFVPDARTLIPSEEEEAAALAKEKRPEVHVLCMARADGKQEAETLLRALSRLKILGTPFKLVAAGAQNAQKALKGLAKTLGLTGDAVFPGSVPNENKPSFYLDADVFVSCPADVAGQEASGVPFCLVEAMSYGLPVVATGTQAQKLVVEDGVSGLVVKQGDEEALARALERLFKDREGRLAMGRAAARRVRERFPETPEGFAGLFSGLSKREPRTR